MDRLFLKLSFRLVFLMITISSNHLEPNLQLHQCLNMPEQSKWNRSFHFNNQELNLKLEVTNRPSHWIINYIFGILARERLGYQSIEFVEQPWDQPENAIDRLDCEDSDCTNLPLVHVNLELWLSLGVTPSLWIPSSRVSDNGPLGPVSRWAVITHDEFISYLFSKEMENQTYSCDHPQIKLKRNFSESLPDFNSSLSNQISVCGKDKCTQSLSKELQQFIQPSSQSHINAFDANNFNSLLKSKSGPSMSILNWYPNGFRTSTLLPSIFLSNSKNKLHEGNSLNNYRWLLYNSNRQSGSHKFQGKDFCRFESQQATKLTWARLKDTLPLIHQLVDRMHFTQAEYDELLELANTSNLSFVRNQKSHYWDIACQWLRFYPTRWNSWTEGWNQKQNLTIAGLFTFYGKWVVPDLDRVALQAINFVNMASDYFGNSEYALTLDVRNLTCVQDIVLNDYFDLLVSLKNRKLIGVIAALCSDSIEPVVEVANFRRQLVVSPTVESARFPKLRHYPYFFRTVPSMSFVSRLLIKLFFEWGWRRLAVFRKDDHFFEPRIFESNGIEVTVDFEMKENVLTYDIVHHRLELMVERRSRIFIIEYFARGTAIILCAAYHLGMQFDAGYVWFLNPWLSGNWWLAPDVKPSECTHQEMMNITSWTFTISHQLITSPMPLINSHASDLRRNQTSRDEQGANRNRIVRSTELLKETSFHKIEKSTSSKISDHENKQNGLRPNYPLDNYAIHTYESVIVLASALVHLLRLNPSAISVLESPIIAQTYQQLVAQTDFEYTIFRKLFETDGSGGSNTAYVREFRSSNRAEELEATSHLRFDSLNGRVADYWLLKQRQINITVPILKWSWNPDVLNEDQIEPADQSATAGSDPFAHFIVERWLANVNWGRNNGPPGDGSETEDCVFGFISRGFGVNCSNATVISTILIVLLIACPCLTLFVVYYRRKLQETERKIRQPYEKLCAELKDIDIPCTDIVLNRRVGQGAFGMVYGGEAKRNGRWEAVAVKVIGSKATYEGKTDFLAEAKLMRSLDHRNVVRLVGICLYPKENHLYLIMEFMLFGDLKTYLLSRRVLAQQNPDDEAIRPSTLTEMAIDIAEGLAYLHRINLIHRDIACRNCLVGPDRVVKIGDFGLTRHVNNIENEGYYRFTRNCELPIRWMSPEAVQLGIFSIHSDIWSYGIVLYEIITFGVFPYDGLGDVEVVERIKRKNFSIVEFLPLAARDTTVSMLIYQCCQHQWQHRPASLEHIINILRKHPECVRPFLTDEPPKPNSTIEALRFQPGAGACIMSKNTLASGDPTPDNVTSGNVVNENSRGISFGYGTRGILATSGSLGGVGKASLAYYSVDSFTDAVTATALRPFPPEVPLHSFGRRRHKTAEGTLGATRQHCTRGGTSLSSGGHTCNSSERSSGDRSNNEEIRLLSPVVGLNFSTTFADHPNNLSSNSKLIIDKHAEDRKVKSYSKSLVGKLGTLKGILAKQMSLDDEHSELASMLPKSSDDFRVFQCTTLAKTNQIDFTEYNTSKKLNSRHLSTKACMLTRSKLEFPDGPSGALTSSRSVSAERICTNHSLNKHLYVCAKSASEKFTGGLVLCGHVVDNSFCAKSDISRPEMGVLPSAPPKGDKIDMPDSRLCNKFSNPNCPLSSPLDSTSDMFRSLLRLFTRRRKITIPSSSCLQTTKSFTYSGLNTAHAFSGSANPQRSYLQLSTSCPSIITTKLSTFSSHVKDEERSSDIPYSTYRPSSSLQPLVYSQSGLLAVRTLPNPYLSHSVSLDSPHSCNPMCDIARCRASAEPQTFVGSPVSPPSDLNQSRSIKYDRFYLV